MWILDDVLVFFGFCFVIYFFGLMFIPSKDPPKQDS